MTNPNEQRELARLLSGRDEPSILEQEAAWSNIAGRLPHRRRRLAWGGFISALAAGAAVFVLMPKNDGFETRGEVSPLVKPACIINEGESPCVSGATLTLEVGAPADRPYLAAFRQDTTGQITWLLPVANGMTAKAPQLPSAELLPQGFKWSGPAGKHTLYTVFSKTPLSRTQVEHHMGDNLEGDTEVLVVRRTIEAR